MQSIVNEFITSIRGEGLPSPLSVVGDGNVYWYDDHGQLNENGNYYYIFDQDKGCGYFGNYKIHGADSGIRFHCHRLDFLYEVPEQQYHFDEVYSTMISSIKKRSEDSEGFRSMDSILGCSFDDEEYLIRGHILKGASVQFLGAPSKSGKSFLLLDWAMSIAYGLPDWNGARVEKGRVLYLVGEAEKSFNKRVEAWKIAHSITDNTPNLVFYYGSQRKLTGSKNSLMEYLKTELFSFMDKPDTIFVDTQQAYCVGDINSDQDATRYSDCYKNLSRFFNCSVVVCHHYGKDESRGMKGAKTFFDISDLIHGIKRSSDGVMELFQEKQKDEAELAPIYLRLEPIRIGENIHGEPITSCFLVKTEAPRKERDKQLDRKSKSYGKDLEMIRAFFNNLSNLRYQHEQDGTDCVLFYRSSLIRYLIDDAEWERKNAADQTNPISNTNTLVSRLIKAGVIHSNPKKISDGIRSKKPGESRQAEFEFSLAGTDFLTYREMKRMENETF